MNDSLPAPDNPRPGRRNYREESELRARVAREMDWSIANPESRLVFLATYFPEHPRLHIIFNTFDEYRVAFFRQPHRIDHHCHLQTLHVQGAHLRQILGFLTSLAKYRGLGGTAAWERLCKLPGAVHEMQLCGATAEQIYAEVLERHIHPFLRDTDAYPELFGLVMQTHYSDHNRLTPRDELEKTKRMLEGLVEYVYLPQAVELDVWAEDLLAELRASGVPEEQVALVRPKRQLIIAPIEGRAQPATLARLQQIAVHTQRLRTGQLPELARRILDESFFREVLHRKALALEPEVEAFVKRWARIFLDYYDTPEVPAMVNPVTISNKALELFIVGMVDRLARREGWSVEKVATHKRQIESLLPGAKSLMKDTYAVSRYYAPYLDVIRDFHEECLVLEPHPAAGHFVTDAITNRELFDIMLPVYRIAAAAGLTGLEVNRGEAHNEVMLEVCERLGLYLTVASDCHSLSLSRPKRLKGDREYGCARNVPGVLFQFPNFSQPVSLRPLEVARSIGRLVGQPLPEEPFWSRVMQQQCGLPEDASVPVGGLAPALRLSRRMRPRWALPAALEATSRAFVETLDRRYAAEEGLRPGAFAELHEYVRLNEHPDGCDDPSEDPAEVALVNSVYHGVRALALLMGEAAPEPPLALAAATLLHDVSRAFGRRSDDGYESDYVRYKAEEQQRSAALVRRLLNDVRFPHAHHDAIVFLVANHEQGAHVQDAAIVRAGHSLPVDTMKAACALIDLADALVFFEPMSVQRYLRRRGLAMLRRKIMYTLDLDAQGGSVARAYVRRRLAEGAYEAEVATLLAPAL